MHRIRNSAFKSMDEIEAYTAKTAQYEEGNDTGIETVPEEGTDVDDDLWNDSEIGNSPDTGESAVWYSTSVLALLALAVMTLVLCRRAGRIQKG